MKRYVSKSFSQVWMFLSENALFRVLKYAKSVLFLYFLTNFAMLVTISTLTTRPDWYDAEAKCNEKGPSCSRFWWFEVSTHLSLFCLLCLLFSYKCIQDHFWKRTYFELSYEIFVTSLVDGRFGVYLVLKIAIFTSFAFLLSKLTWQI